MFHGGDRLSQAKLYTKETDNRLTIIFKQKHSHVGLQRKGMSRLTEVDKT